MPNYNKETGIAYGTIYGHSCPLLEQEIFDNGNDDTFDAYKAQCVRELIPILEEHGQRDAESMAESIVDGYEWDNYQADESDYSYEDSYGNKFLLSYLGGAPLIWVIFSSVITHARPCSPCVPGAGDLDSLDEDGIKCYGIPDYYLDKEEDATQS